MIAARYKRSRNIRVMLQHLHQDNSSKAISMDMDRSDQKASGKKAKKSAVKGQARDKTKRKDKGNTKKTTVKANKKKEVEKGKKKKGKGKRSDDESEEEAEGVRRNTFKFLVKHLSTFIVFICYIIICELVVLIFLCMYADESVKLKSVMSALVDLQSTSGQTALHIAAQYGDLDCVRELVNGKATVDIMVRLKRNI